MTYNHGDLWPIVYDALRSKYEIIAWIDVLREDVDILPKKLYQRLLPWADGTLTPNQRIIVYHRDTEYYFESGSSGFFIQNLYRISNYLNIPSEFIIFLHAQPGKEKESNKLAQMFNIPPMQTIYCPYQWCPPPAAVRPFDINIQHIQKSFICLNGLFRSHRAYVLSVLKESDIFESGMISLRDNMPIKSWAPETGFIPTIDIVYPDVELPEKLHLCCLNNPTRVNDLIIFTQAQRNIMIKWIDSLTPHCSPLITGGPNQEDSRYQADFLQLALWNVINETVGEYPYPYISEKTWKAILTKRPFILLGGNNSLQQLKDLGFKTFDQWIDESYDQETNFTDRCDLALAQLKQFCNHSGIQLQEIATQMQEVLEYNFNHYITGFGGQMVENFIKNRL
jgi:hypothetical protein